MENSSLFASEEAFVAFMKEHQFGVLQYLKGLCRQTDLVEDLFQETFIQAWMKGTQLKKLQSARAWLLTIARNQYLMQRRKNGEESTETETIEELALKAGWGERAEVESSIDYQAIEQALQSLSQEDREILILRDLQNIDGEKTAKILNITVEAMKSRLHRARLKLKALVGKKLNNAHKDFHAKKI